MIHNDNISSLIPLLIQVKGQCRCMNTMSCDDHNNGTVGTNVFCV